MLTNKQEIAFFATLGAILITFLSLAYFYGYKVPQREALEIIEVENKFADIALTAKGAYVLDVNSGEVLYAKNENERLALASVTKVMSALVASEIALPESVVTITGEALRAEGDSGLLNGERWMLKELLDFSLISSANDGMRAIALTFGALDSTSNSTELIMRDFVSRMNRKANELGMKNTYYFNDTGLDETKDKGGAYGSAKDQAILFEYILREKPFLLTATREASISAISLNGLIHNAKNTSSITGSIPGIIASKTGFTDLAGGNLVVAFDPEIGRPIIISVLGSTVEGRFSDMLMLIKASLESLK